MRAINDFGVATPGRLTSGKADVLAGNELPKLYLVYPVTKG